MAEKEPQPWIGLVTKKIKEENGCMIVSGLCLTRYKNAKGPLDTRELRIISQNNDDAIKISFGKRYGLPGPEAFRINTYRMEIDLS